MKLLDTKALRAGTRKALSEHGMLLLKAGCPSSSDSAVPLWCFYRLQIFTGYARHLSPGL